MGLEGQGGGKTRLTGCAHSLSSGTGRHVIAPVRDCASELDFSMARAPSGRGWPPVWTGEACAGSQAPASGSIRTQFLHRISGHPSAALLMPAPVNSAMLPNSP